jgi:hypothetical protein
MNVKLISYSKASEYETYEEGGLLNIQDLIAFCAKVSNPTAQINSATSEKVAELSSKAQTLEPF